VFTFFVGKEYFLRASHSAFAIRILCWSCLIAETAATFLALAVSAATSFPLAAEKEGPRTTEAVAM
jgi:hypothetical protein